MPCSSKRNFCRQTMPSFIHEDDKNGRLTQFQIWPRMG
uniref:Cytochrome P450 family 2 subfamily R member 1 n=1 Tax=Homo sapiens TaxID=9606 RepID=E9PS56_HUMAN